MNLAGSIIRCYHRPRRLGGGGGEMAAEFLRADAMSSYSHMRD